MATQPNDEELELTEDMELDEAEDEQANDAETDGDDSDDDDDEPEAKKPAEEFVPHFVDDAESDGQETDLVKHLRAKVRSQAKELASRPVPQQERVEVGERPKVEDYDYDQDRYDKALDAWQERREQRAQQDRSASEAKANQERAWQRVEDEFQAKSRELKFADRDVAHQKATDTLSQMAQAVIKKHADDPALFMYALGRSPSKMAALERVELDSGGDPMAITKAMVKMESNLMREKPAKRPPDPDRPVQGKAPSMSSSEKQMQKLEAEAERTGNRTKIIAYKRRMKEKNNG